MESIRYEEVLYFVMVSMCKESCNIGGLLNTIIVKFILEVTLDGSYLVYEILSKIFEDVISLMRNWGLD